MTQQFTSRYLKYKFHYKRTKQPLNFLLNQFKKKTSQQLMESDNSSDCISIIQFNIINFLDFTSDSV